MHVKSEMKNFMDCCAVIIFSTKPASMTYCFYYGWKPSSPITTHLRLAKTVISSNKLFVNPRAP